ncbi:peptidase [Bacillus salacetis]|uniref:Peptidase n=1 Tax=Bacillus salacetis TaxID=2315464 RepID=A0A3A1QN63_9BACI|nr:peptidase [Bacillus salacetis]RIW28508.1 peptidase [Bacillus salacetis]
MDNTAVKEWIYSQETQAVRLLQKLIQEKSVRGQESKAQAVIIEKCREIGLQLDIWEIQKKDIMNHPFYRCDRDDFSGNPNVIGVLKGQGGGRSIILNGHIDVVPEGDEAAWNVDPFSGVHRNGKVFGRGATDMKGGTVALLLAIEALKATGVLLKGDIIFQSVIEEESGGAGTLAALLRGYTADGAIIPEPTNLKLFPKQQGSMWFRILVKGKQAHGGTRYEGVNAIEKGLEVVKRLQDLEKKRNENVLDPLYGNIPIPFPINIGKFESGKWPSSVPDLAVIEGRIGVGPHETMEGVEKELQYCLEGLSEKDRWFEDHPVTLEWFGGRWQPGSIESDHPFMEAVSEAYLEVFDSPPVIEASPWGTDGGILSKGGNIPVIIFGPGTTESAHDANEFIEVRKILQSAEVIASAVIKWCEVEYQ